MLKFIAAVAVLTAGIPGIASALDTSTSAEVIAVASEPTPVTVGPNPNIRFSSADAPDRDRVDQSLELFRGAGLELPDLDVRFSDDPTDCQGHDGLFDPSTRPWTISICSDVGYVVTHELAHAWEAANLDDSEREHYMVVRGFETWNGQHVDRDERAIEEAAFMVQQNLMASDHVDTTSDRWQDRIFAYELLTGTTSPVVVD